MSSSKKSEASTSPIEAKKSDELSLASVRSEYERADCFCAEVQSFRGKAGIPAMNELRNAGKHILDALNDDGSTGDMAQLQAAFGHCRRASYEAFEAGILTALEVIKKFKIDYQEIVVTQILPDWNDILIEAGEAQRAVEEGRQKDFDRAADHTVRMEAFRRLRKLCEKLDICRDEANKVLAQNGISEQRHARTMALTYLGLALAALGTVLGLPSFIDWATTPSEAKEINPPIGEREGVKNEALPSPSPTPTIIPSETKASQ